MFEINGKVAFITGALGGIGVGYTKALLQANIKGVSLIDISDQQLQKLLNAISLDDQKKVFFIKCDVSDENQLKNAYNKTIDKFSQLDIVINNAGVLDEINIDRTLNINLIATVKSTYMAFQNYLPKYRKDEEAVIVNTASITGLIPFPLCPVYAATKSGIIFLGASLGTEPHYILKQVRIITICPSATNTDLLINYNLPEEYNDMHQQVRELAHKNLQSPDNVGKALVELLNTAPNGSVWISQNNEPPLQVDTSNMEVMKAIHMI